MIVTFLFVLSALSFSGSVSAFGKHYRGPTGTCYFTKPTYSIGETMSIHAEGSFGAATKGSFEVVLKNPGGSVVTRFQQYLYDVYPNGFTDTVTYTLKPTDPTGTWTVELDYIVVTKRKVTTTLITMNEALVNPLA